MNKEVKTEWIAALRSGKYGQSKQRLKKKEGYCCLGVLCEIYPDVEFKENNQFPYELEHESVIGATSFPPPFVMEWSGLSENEAWKLADLNDDGFTFDQIAEKIEDL